MRFLAPLVLIAQLAMSQPNIDRMKALNLTVDYANRSSQEMSAIAHSIKSYYPSLENKNKYGTARYVCPVQLDDYYLNTALQALQKHSTLNAIVAQVRVLSSAAEEVDKKCKELDTYYKLEDYKRDDYAQAKVIIEQVPVLLKAYQAAALDLELKLLAEHGKAAGVTSSNVRQVEQLMHTQAVKERGFVSAWSYNLNEKVHTGWIDDTIGESIRMTEQHIEAFDKLNLKIPYPASSMMGSYREALQNILDLKRRALDGYNFEARKTDEYSNDIYLDFINYYNNTLLSSINGFIKYAAQDNYIGLELISFSPLLEMRLQERKAEVVIKPFEDTPLKTLSLSKQPLPISKETFFALSAYIDFLNENVRQVGSIHRTIINFKSSLSYHCGEKKSGGKLTFSYKDFQLPLSHHLKIISLSKATPAAISTPLTTQATVILNLLREVDQRCATIQTSIESRAFERDNCEALREQIDRIGTLLTIWDDRKQRLYEDVRKVFESYPAKDQSSWQKSGQLLYELTKFDREALFQAKQYYAGDSSVKISTAEIDKLLRQILADEYTNMKGIEKIGRNNGRCPYTPYEDLPATSRTLSEKLTSLKTVRSDYSRHPYEGFVYLYNEIADDYNKFSSLSPTPLLQTIKQVNLFEREPNVRQRQPIVNKASEVDSKPPTDVPKESNNGVNGATIRMVNNTERSRDTVYIEKRDTIYLRESVDYSRSMEGYATNNLVLLLDVSGSMNAPEKLPLLKASILDLLSMMRPEDRVAIVAFSGKANILLKPTSFKDEERIRQAINNLNSSGKTDVNAGFKLAYKVADDNYIRGGNNRIVLATDGEFNTSEETETMIQQFATQDIFLTIFNFGKGAGASRSLAALAAKGKGNFETISKANVETSLIREVKSKRKR